MLRFAAGMVVTMLVLPPPPSTGAAEASACVDCHGSAATMKRLGYPHFTVTPREVRLQSGMPADCHHCHGGNPAAREKDAAHAGIGRLVAVRKTGLTGVTMERKHPLSLGSNPMERIRLMADQAGTPVPDRTASILLWQDKRTDTLSQDFGRIEKSCGGCHKEEFAEFTRSTMARNGKQSSYRTWTDGERGPHNCGVWFTGNYEAIAANTAVPFDRTTNALNQRQCNTCHVGCLDCHYDPRPIDPANPKSGMHTFRRTPPPENCYGGGRGQTCHAGPEERRRGAGYFGGAYANPEGVEPDVHLRAQVACLDCHESSRGKKGLTHAMVRRQATCDRCHGAIVRSHALSTHRTLTCEACHIRTVGGYQGTFWGPGILGGKPTPFFKYKEYYGIMVDPILIRDQRGRWIPVKPFPMAVMNVKAAALEPGLHWRWPATLPDLERTDDAFGYVGLVGGLPENNKALLWIQMDKVSHKYGTPRPCDSCHGSADGAQRREVNWEFTDAGALPFSGRQTVVADARGLAIRGIAATDKIEPSAGTAVSSFAPWFYLKDAWSIPGNFSLPAITDRGRYERLKERRDEARKAGIIHR
ncbi:cytochrome c3 family protein [Geobacter pickeringii]|uniref:Cytochrome C n=1 Tax=Geobacter pickeringii TaxID=345632 RepID=A0A0B5B710_9BACT|nr:cytochrome c3 family protein [Geobacter pickeringii]AJE02322.1 cytochrome C [Geobacter pickeringii]